MIQHLTLLQRESCCEMKNIPLVMLFWLRRPRLDGSIDFLFDVDVGRFSKNVQNFTTFKITIHNYSICMCDLLCKCSLQTRTCLVRELFIPLEEMLFVEIACFSLFAFSFKRTTLVRWDIVFVLLFLSRFEVFWSFFDVTCFSRKLFSLPSLKNFSTDSLCRSFSGSFANSLHTKQNSIIEFFKILSTRKRIPKHFQYALR